MTLPVHPGRLHRHMGHMMTLEPIRQLQEVPGHRAEAANLGLLLAPGPRAQQTNSDGLLVNVQAAAVRLEKRLGK